jgi:hypothetical protein
MGTKTRFDKTKAPYSVARRIAGSARRGGGSVGIIGAARAGFMSGRDPGDETGLQRILACIR